MRRLQVVGSLVLLLAWCLPWAAAQTPPAEPPVVESFFRADDIGAVELSPSGRWLALKTTIGGERAGVVVFDLQNWGQVTQAVRFSDLDVRQFHWVNDDRLVFDTVDGQRGSGDFDFYPGLFSVRRDGSELRQLVALRHTWGIVEAPGIRRQPLSPQHRLLAVPRDGSGEVIVGESMYDNQGELLSVAAKRLNVDTGAARSLALGAPDNVVRWWFDPRGEARVVEVHAGPKERLYARRSGETAWQQIAEYDWLQTPFEPLSVDTDGTLYVLRPDGPAGTLVLARFDFQTRQPRRDAVVATPGFDFRGQIVEDLDTGRAVGVQLTTDAELTVWFDARMKAVQAEVDARLPGRVNRLGCRRCGSDDSVVLVLSYSDRDPGSWLVYRPASRDWRVIGAVRKDIDPARMGTRDFVRIRARDGRDLPVWVTYPPGPRSKTPLPTVVLVHGGPWVRGGFWRWDAWPQFLASRGYLVVEPEFRGSSGYGGDHERAGDRQWGLAMQNDIADALLWAVAQGRADAGRACIAGASYGGYATLMGLVRHPQLYRCGVAWVAVTDPRLIFEWSWGSDVGDDSRRYGFPVLIGDPVRDATMLADAAPVNHATEIKAPLLMGVGGLDARVRPVNATRMRSALTAAGRPPQWAEYHDEGHSWNKLATRVDFGRRVERFLAEQLQPRARGEGETDGK